MFERTVSEPIVTVLAILRGVKTRDVSFMFHPTSRIRVYVDDMKLFLKGISIDPGSCLSYYKLN